MAMSFNPRHTRDRLKSLFCDECIGHLAIEMLFNLDWKQEMLLSLSRKREKSFPGEKGIFCFIRGEKYLLMARYQGEDAS